VAEKNVENWTDQDSLEELARMRRMLMADGLSGTLLDAACKRCSEALARVVASQKGRWLLSGEHAEEHCEWELSERHQGRVVHKVIDRSFVDADGIRWIVDYKTASHEGGDIELFLASEEQRHRGQLIGYVQLLKRLEPEREIKAALYFPLLDAWREINQG